MKKALAFDIGGTKIYSTIIDETGKIVSEIEKFSTPKTLDEIKNILKTQIVKHDWINWKENRNDFRFRCRWKKYSMHRY